MLFLDLFIFFFSLIQNSSIFKCPRYHWSEIIDKIVAHRASCFIYDEVIHINSKCTTTNTLCATPPLLLPYRQAVCGPEASLQPGTESPPAAGLPQQTRAQRPDVPVRVGVHGAAGCVRGPRAQGQSVDLRQGQLRSHTGHPQGETAPPGTSSVFRSRCFQYEDCYLEVVLFTVPKTHK